MQLNIKHIMLSLSMCAAVAACTDEVGNVVICPGSDKTPIILSVGGTDAAEPTTRAVITDGTGKTLNPFDVDTKIFMVMKSEYDTGNPDFKDPDDPHVAKYNVARGDVNIANNDDTHKWSLVEFDSKNQRYWDDAHARSSMLSIYAYAQKGQAWTNCTFNGTQYKTDVDITQPYAWTKTEIVPTILKWRATHQDGKEDQNQQSVMAQDLLFSNNLADNGSGKDKRLKFNFTSRKFPQEGEANMIFYHAMSKITIKIIEGEGFDKISANKANDFKFTTTGGNIILKQFNHTGKFDIRQGEFTEIATNGTTPIPSIYLRTTDTNATGTNPHYVLEALAVPSIANNGASRFVDDRKSLDNDVMMEFEIDHSLYQITHDDLYEALKNKLNVTMKSDNGDYIPLEAGKNYVFTFTVGKTKIKDITAQVAEWEEVEADEFEPSNARITLNVEDRSGASTTTEVTSGMDIYRALDAAPSVTDTYESYEWTTGYTTDGKASATYDTTDPLHKHWTTGWFWDSNKSYYHFRTLSPTTQVVEADASKGDYTIITSSSCNSEAEYNEMAWGAPFLDVDDDYKFKYDAVNGFDGTGSGHQIYKAIGPTKEQIKVLMFHMMSGVHFTIKTSASTEPDKVELFDGTNHTRVELVAYYPEGKVRLGTGLVDASGTKSTELAPYNIPFANAADATHYVDQEYFFSAVPQSLENVKLHITAPDNNMYIVDLKDVIAQTSKITQKNITFAYPSAGSGKVKITHWVPNTQYHYTFTLTKKGITDIQATIVDWETVTANEETVQIK